jgi:hypothetical protein
MVQELEYQARVRCQTTALFSRVKYWNTMIASLKYFVYQTKSFLNYGKERDEEINIDRLHGKVERNS